MTEVWRDVPGYEGCYQASNLGRVRSLPRTMPKRDSWGGLTTVSYPGKILSPARNKTTRYWSLALGKNNTQMLHRVIASTFCENPLNLPEVNHKDGDRSNNQAGNLEWVSSSGNKCHSYRELERKQHVWTTPVKLVKGDEVLTFPSQLAAAKHLGVVAASVRSAFDKKHFCKGYRVEIV